MEKKLKERQVSDEMIKPTAANITEINQRYKERVRILYLPKYFSLSIPMIGLESAIAPTGIATAGDGLIESD